MSGLSGQDRIKLRQKVTGLLGLFSRDEDSERQEPGQKPYDLGYAEILPSQPVNALELLSLLKRLRTGEMSWSSVNPVFLPFIHPISALSSNPRTDELYGLMVRLQPYIMPLNPISFEVPSTTPRGAMSLRNGGTAKRLGISSSSD